jgi:hypothetical protein
VSRKLFTLCSAASLLLCAAVCVLWVRSYQHRDIVTFPQTSGIPSLVTSRGTLLVEGGGRRPGPPVVGMAWTTKGPDAIGPRRAQPGEPGVRVDVAAAGFGYFRTDGGAMLGATYFPAWTAAVPLVGIAVPLALLPAGWLWSRDNRRRRRAAGRCPACGYDLRATPARCPECGAAGTRSTG